jgi:hypothetical protein
MALWMRQFVLNFIFGTLISALWYYGAFSFTKSFWVSTIIINVITFFLSRWVVYRDGNL